MRKSITYKLLPHQKQFVQSKKQFVAMVCGRGAGKSFVASLLAAMKLIQGERIICFAQNHKSLQENFMKEVTLRLDEMIGFDNYKYNRGSQKIEIPKSNGVIFGATYESQDAVRGFTQISTLILDEAALSKPDILEVAAPCMRALPEGVEPKTFCLTTPKAGSWFNTYVLDKLENKPDEIELINAKTLDNKFISETEYNVIKNSFSSDVIMRQELEGELLNLQAENSVLAGITFKHGELAMPDKGRVCVGIDGSGWGKDQTVITYRIGLAYMQKCYGVLSGPECRNEVKSMFLKHPGWHCGEINIDQAYGEKYYENLCLDYECVDLINFGGKATDEQYANKRCEMYFDMCKKLREGMPITDEIEKELNVTLFEFNQNGKLKLIPKDDIKLVLKHSPDKSDSLALTFANGYGDRIYEEHEEEFYINPEY